MSEFQEFIQQQAQAAEAEFNASLKGVISEWEKRSGSIIFNFEDLLDAAKKTIQSDTERIENLLIPIEKNIKTLSESVSVSKTVQALLQEHIQSSNTFGAQLQSSLGKVLQGQTTGIIPQMELHERSLQTLYEAHQENNRQIVALATASEGSYAQLALLIKENNKHLNDMQEQVLRLHQKSEEKANDMREQVLRLHQESEEKAREAFLAVQTSVLTLTNSTKRNFTIMFIFIFTIATIFILYLK